MRKGKRSRNIVEAIELLLSNGNLYDIVDITESSTQTIRRLMGRINVERKTVSKWGVEGTYYRLKRR